MSNAHSDAREPANDPNDGWSIVPGKHRPNADDARPQRPMPNDVGPDTPPAELVRRIKADRLQESRSTYLGFCANMRTIVHLYWLHENIRASKKVRSSGATVGGADYLVAAQQAGVKRTMAYNIIQFGLHSHIDEIWRKVETEAGQWNARTGLDTYPYPTFGRVISWFKPENRAQSQADGEKSDIDPESDNNPDKSNRTPKENAEEALRLADALRAANRLLEEARANFRKAQQKHDQDIDAYERRLAEKDERIALLESRLALVVKAEQPVPKGQEDLEAQRSDQRSAAEVPEPAPYFLSDRGRPLVEIRRLEERHQVPGWRGRLSEARQIRADFLAFLDAHGLASLSNLPVSAAEWAVLRGRPACDLVADYGSQAVAGEPDPISPAATPASDQEQSGGDGLESAADCSLGDGNKAAVPARVTSRPSSDAGTASGARMPEPPQAPGNPGDDLDQSIAHMMFRRMMIAKIKVSPDAVHVDAYRETKTLFLRARLAPNRGVDSDFSLRVNGKHGRLYLTERLPVELAPRQAKIAEIQWDAVLGGDTRSDLIAGCKIAKAHAETFVWLEIIDGKLTASRTDEPAPGNTRSRMVREDLEWLLRKDATRIMYSKLGVLSIVVPGLGGDYEFFLRGETP